MEEYQYILNLFFSKTEEFVLILNMYLFSPEIYSTSYFVKKSVNFLRHETNKLKLYKKITVITIVTMKMCERWDFLDFLYK